MDDDMVSSSKSDNIMETPKSASTAKPTDAPIPEGMVQIIIPEGKKLKKTVVQKFSAGREAASPIYALKANDGSDCSILAVFVNPVTADSTVVYGQFES